MVIQVSGIDVDIVKKDIKNMHLYVYPPNGLVQVSAPLKMSDKSIELFVRTKISWIRKQRENIKNQERQDERQYISGESLYVWGKQYYLKVELGGNRNNIKLSGNTAILTARKNSNAKQRDKYLKEWYRSLLKKELEKLIPVWEERTNLHVNECKTRYMITKWGSCKPIKSSLLFNVQLAKKPIKCLNYIILHELTHLKFRNHDEKFTSFLDEYMPNWREIKKELNDSKLDYMNSSRSIRKD